MKITKKLIKSSEDFIKKNGACGFDFKSRNVILYDGGLFSLGERKVMLRKFLRMKKLPNGNYQGIYSKKKYQETVYDAYIWMEEINETINYFKRLKRFLNKQGIKTERNLK